MQKFRTICMYVKNAVQYINKKTLVFFFSNCRLVNNVNINIVYLIDIALQLFQVFIWKKKIVC